MFVRPINFVDYFEVQDIKTAYSANLFLYDVDNDNDIELLIGNWDSGDLQSYGEADVEHRKGDLHIVKYGLVWKKAIVDGIVSCISAGNITGNSYADILVICSNCICNIFRIFYPKAEETDHVDHESCQLKLTHEQIIAPNAKNIVIKDIDKDGINEVIVGFTDRAVRMYKWSQNQSSESGFLIEMIKWELCSQIGGLTIHCSPKNGIQILASLTGGCYAVLIWKSVIENNNEKRIPYIDYKQMKDEYKDNVNVDIRSEIIGNIRRCHLQSKNSCDSIHDSIEKGQPPYLAVCTIDGQVMLLDENEKIWQVQLGKGELFGLSKVDITNNDAEEVVICSWEGVTYIINHHKEIARFSPKHQCQAFLSGKFAVAPGINQPVLIYSTFENSLVIYYNLNLDRIPARSFLQDISEPLRNSFSKSNIDVNNLPEIQKFIHSILYKMPINNFTNDTNDFFDTESDNIQSPLLKVRPNRSDIF